MNYKILSYYKSVTIKKKYGFLGLKTDYIHNTIIIKDTDPEFNNIFKNSDYKIHSILRLYDNKILTVGDETDFYTNLFYNRNQSIQLESEPIGDFWLDGTVYVGVPLKSKSGLQAFFGGGTFVDIMDFNKTPLKELRKQKLENLKITHL